MKYLLLISLLNPIFSFKNIPYFANGKQLKLNSVNTNDPNFEKDSIGQLIKNIDNKKIDNIYFSNDLKTAISTFDKIDDFTITNSNPAITDLILEHANSNNIKTTILKEPFDPIRTFSSTFYGIFDFFFFSTISYIIFNSIFSFFIKPDSGSNLLNKGNSFTSPFKLFNDKNLDEDKNSVTKANITLSSWAGSPEIFQECSEIVSYLNNRTLYEIAGAQIPRGILLEGPPGTGKTLIAKAIASECDANFISIAASEFVELYVGLGAAKVRKLFAKARQNSPCIIFIDEIDAVGKQRGTGINMGNDEREQTLNQILAEMDGFSTNDNVIVIAATNRRDVLDNALLRPGRFDRIINVPLPDKPSRISIIEVHMKNKTFEENIQLDSIAEMTSGFSGAQLKNLINEAAINAVREAKTVISNQNIQDALFKLTVGIIKTKDTRSNDAINRVAIHEMGHAFLANYFNEYFELIRVSIQSTYNGAGGFTLFSEYPNITDSGLYTKDLLKKRIIIALGGKAAEHVFYGDEHVSLGAMQDLKQANSLAKQMVGTYGMGDTLKTFYNENTDNGRTPFLGRSLATNDGIYSEKIKQTFDDETRLIVDTAYSQAIEIIQDNLYKINILVNMLIGHTNLDGKWISDFLKYNRNISNYANNDSY